jgi:transposase
MFLACFSGSEVRTQPDPTSRRTLNPAQRNQVERMFCRLKDWRRIATRYDKLAANFQSAVFIAATITWWAQ